MAHTLGQHLPRGPRPDQRPAAARDPVQRHRHAQGRPVAEGRGLPGPGAFQEIAKLLGLPAATPAEGVGSYTRAVEELSAKCGIPASFAEEGVDEQALLEALPAPAMNAYADQRAPANPRMPMTDGMQRLVRQAYYGAAEATPSA
ncbi:hypothetical protein ACIQU4_29985 [Streptomyces sp. NPDC090741]|uniref:hypothetical protein n=1 Tax=Streptomyces sp. NPDC090741 TaxID=3365967 RepID=UPI0038049CE0